MNLFNLYQSKGTYLSFPAEPDAPVELRTSSIPVKQMMDRLGYVGIDDDRDELYGYPDKPSFLRYRIPAKQFHFNISKAENFISQSNS